MHVRPRHRVAAATAVVALCLTACGSGDGDSIESGEDASEPSDDPAASASLTGAELVWAVDGEPVGGEFSYAEPIERTRFDAGLRWELRFDATGDVGGAAVDGRRTTTVNGDLIESGREGVGPERGVYYVDGAFDVEVGDGGLVASIDVARPVSAATLIDDRRRFQEVTGIDPDDEQVDFSEVAVFNVDRVVDFPPLPVDGINVYEYEFDGDLVLGNGTAIPVDSVVELRVVGPDPVALDLTGSCGSLAELYLAQVEPQLDDPEFVHLDRMHAMRAVEQAVSERDCAAVDFVLPVCAATTDLVERSGGDPSRPPWSDVTIACPQGGALQEATVIEAAHADGTLQMVVPATRDGLPPLAVAVATPTWTVTVDPPRTNGQEVQFEWPGASGFRDAWFEIASSAMPPTLLDERFEARVTAEQPDAREVARGTGAVGGERSEWFVSIDELGYEFGGAVVLDDERLWQLRGRVTADDGRVLTDEAVTELVRCVVESVVVAPWRLAADPPTPTATCASTGEFAAPAEVEPPTTDGPPVDETVADDQSEFIANLPDRSSVDGATIVIPVAATGGERAHLVTLVGPGWTVAEISESPGRQVVDLMGPEPGATLQVAVTFGSDPASTIDRLVAPVGSDGTIVTDDVVGAAGRDVRVVVSEWTTLSDEARDQASMGSALDDSRVLTARVIVPADGALDAAAILRGLLDSLIIAE